MSQLNVDNIQNRTSSNGGPNFPSGISVAVGQTAYIHGDLKVDGTQTIINTENLNVADKTVGIGSTTTASNTTADGAGIEVFASSSQVGNNKTITWQNSSTAWTFAGGGIVATDAVVGSAVTINSSGIKAGIITATTINATTFSGDGSSLTGMASTDKVATTTLNVSGISTFASQVSGITAMGANAVDCSTANYFTKTISGATTFTFTNVPTGVAYGMTMEVTLNGSNAITWPSSVKWPADAAPAVTDGKTQLFMFVTDDGGTRWRGSSLVDYTN